MDFRLDDEHEALRKTVEQFAAEVVAPRAAHYDETGEFPYDTVAQMGRMGLFGLPFPEEYGGMGGDFFALCLAIEELARADSSVAITLEAAVGLGSMPVYRFGTEEQKREWLPRLCSGEALAAFGLTEPGGGSDAGNPRTRAVLDGDQWVVDGSKACVDESVRYAKEREAFGQRIGSYQAVAFRIADMQMRTHVARVAYYDAAARLCAGQPFKHQAAIAKLYSSTIAVDNARDATQVFGGYGFMNEYPVARHWRDAKILEIGEGTSEVQRMLIARELGL